MIPALEYASKICYSTRETLQFSYEMAKKYSRPKDGIFVECGSAAGAQVIAMLAGDPGHETWVFESFAGIPLPSNRDNQLPGLKMLTEDEQRQLPDPGKQVLESSGATVVSQADFMTHIRNALTYWDYQSLVIFPGWFEEVLPRMTKFEPISILRLDGDLFQSTFVCLQYLFPHLLKGGVCIIDDWELPGCQAAAKEYFELIGYEPDYKSVSNIKYFYK